MTNNLPAQPPHRELPPLMRAYSVVDRALVRASSLRILGRSPGMILRNRLNRLLFRTVFAKGGEVTTRLRSGALLAVRSNDQASASLMFEGKKNDLVAERLIALSDVAQSFFDVGANYGYFAVVAAHRHPQLPVVAVEPNPALIELIRRSVALNRFGNVTVAPVACGESPGSATLTFASGSSGTGSLGARVAANAAETAEVQVIRFDDIFFAHYNSSDSRPAVIKIDVEGFEAQMLGGAPRALATHPIIVCEVTSATFADVARLAAVSGLEMYDFARRRIDPAATFKLGRKKTDVLICHPRLLDKLPW